MAESMFSVGGVSEKDVTIEENKFLRDRALEVAQLSPGRASVYGATQAGGMLMQNLAGMAGMKTVKQEKAETISNIMKDSASLDQSDPANLEIMGNKFIQAGFPDIGQKFLDKATTLSSTLYTAETSRKTAEAAESKAKSAAEMVPIEQQKADVLKQGQDLEDKFAERNMIVDESEAASKSLAANTGKLEQELTALYADSENRIKNANALSNRILANTKKGQLALDAKFAKQLADAKTESARAALLNAKDTLTKAPTIKEMPVPGQPEQTQFYQWVPVSMGAGGKAVGGTWEAITTEDASMIRDSSGTTGDRSQDIANAFKGIMDIWAASGCEQMIYVGDGAFCSVPSKDKIADPKVFFEKFGTTNAGGTGMSGIDIWNAHLGAAGSSFAIGSQDTVNSGTGGVVTTQDVGAETATPTIYRKGDVVGGFEFLGGENIKANWRAVSN